MDNQMIIILAILLLFFMKNKKENMKTGCGWNGDQPCHKPGQCDSCSGNECFPGSSWHKKCCDSKPRWAQPQTCTRGW